MVTTETDLGPLGPEAPSFSSLTLLEEEMKPLTTWPLPSEKLDSPHTEDTSA